MANLSFVQGSTDRPLSEQTLGDIVRDNASEHPSNIALKAGNQSYSFKDLDQRSTRVASALIHSGIKKGEHVGIVAANRAEYIDFFLGIGRIGRVAVALNPTESPEQLGKAVLKRACKILFIARCGERSMADHVQQFTSQVSAGENNILERIIGIDIDTATNRDSHLTIQSLEEFLAEPMQPNIDKLRREEQNVKSDDILTLQFTSGTTGEPKAAMLSHRGVINNALHLSERMQLTQTDTLCCPAALFRTFGIIMGFLTAFVWGTQVILPSEEFNAETTVNSIIDNRCTALLGEYRIFSALLNELQNQKRRVESLRTCLAAGAVVPVETREAMRSEMGLEDFVIAHGQTEMGPMVFMTGPDDPKDTQSVGNIMPHRTAKVVDEDTRELLPRGQKGELLVSGCGLLEGYYGDEEKTKAALRRDDEGNVWFHTGDEAYFDDEGYCYYGGRLGDIIKTTSGARIYPDEIEKRLLEFQGIDEASVIGVRESQGKGEVVGAFLNSSDSSHPDDDKVKRWVQEKLGADKVPKHLFWVGDPGVGEGIPKTYNGKPRKRDMSELAANILQTR